MTQDMNTLPPNNQSSIVHSTPLSDDIDYNTLIEQRAAHVFDVMASRVTPQELATIKDAFALAREAHAPQKRKTGEPYILHPIAVATIAAEELMLDSASVIAAFLHDVVEDTPYTVEDIEKRFGRDVSFLVRVVTKQKKDKYDEYGNTPWRVGSCVAYAPADDPRIAALIMVDEPSISSVYGSVVAAPYISNLLSFILPYIGVEAQYTAEELENLDVTLSNYVGASVENASADLSWRGFAYEIIGSGSTVTAQVPQAGSMISSDTGILLLYTGDEKPANTITVPNVVGMSAYNANNTLVNLGLNVTFSGSVNGSSATVISQNPAANTVVSRGTIVEVTLRHLDMTD